MLRYSAVTWAILLLLVVESVLLVYNVLAEVGLVTVWSIITIVSASYLFHGAVHHRTWVKKATLIWLNTWYIVPLLGLLIIQVMISAAPSPLIRFPDIERAISLVLAKFIVVYLVMLITLLRSKTDEVCISDASLEEHSS